MEKDARERRRDEITGNKGMEVEQKLKKNVRGERERRFCNRHKFIPDNVQEALAAQSETNPAFDFISLLYVVWDNDSHALAGSDFPLWRGDHKMDSACGNYSLNC